MSVAVNSVMIGGNLGADPEPGQTRNGHPYLKMRVATKRKWKDQDGTAREETDWHNVKVYGKQVDPCQRFLHRGKAVLVEGRLLTYSWEDDNKEKRRSTEVVANRVHFLGGGRQEGSAPPASPGPPPPPPPPAPRHRPREPMF